MIRIDLGLVRNPNDYDELARMFLPRGEYELVFEQTDVFEGVAAKLEKSRKIYELLSEKTGRRPMWGVLTGVKPAKLYAALAGASGEDEARRILTDEYLVSEPKTDLLARVFARECEALPPPAHGIVSVYIGIPFCPSRCAYCSFTSEVASEKLMGRYLEALYRELDFVGLGMKRLGLTAESVYIGGGTPTVLTVSMLEDLLARVEAVIPPVPDGAERTVEAGRPDTISYLKALTLKREGVSRVSVNPQSLNEKTLSAIGRRHLASDFEQAFETVRASGIEMINTDVIAGLPGETTEDFRRTIEGVLALEPDNVTVHTLAVKRGSRLHEADPGYQYYSKEAGTMLELADERLSGIGMEPYYLYRQKQTVDNLENVGYAKKGIECVYNIRIMQERQTVLALGAGASTKLYFPEEDRIERVFNVADAELYIERAMDMIDRKRPFFERNHEC